MVGQLSEALDSPAIMDAEQDAHPTNQITVLAIQFVDADFQRSGLSSPPNLCEGKSQAGRKCLETLLMPGIVLRCQPRAEAPGYFLSPRWGLNASVP
ncbi:MAG: hypothetical protein WBG50_03435 [Desulfomonilaceae bacterium]